MGWMHGNHIIFKTAEANWLATHLWVRRDFVNSKQRIETVTIGIIPTLLFVFYQIAVTSLGCLLTGS